MVEVGVEKNGSTNRRMSRHAPRGLRMKLRRRFDLRAQVRRCSQKKPRTPINADCNLRLGASFTLKGCGAQATTVRAGAIPLGESSAGRGAWNLDLHLGSVQRAGQFSFWARKLEIQNDKDSVG